MHAKIILVVLTCLMCGCNGFAQKTATGTLLVLNKADNNMVVIDVATLKVVATVPTGEGPHEMTVSSDGKLAFVANSFPQRDPPG